MTNCTGKVDTYCWMRMCHNPKVIGTKEFFPANFSRSDLQDFIFVQIRFHSILILNSEQPTGNTSPYISSILFQAHGPATGFQKIIDKSLK